MEVVHKKLVGFIAKDMQPISVVENIGFVEFVECLNPRVQLPSRTTVRDYLIPNEYEAEKAKLREELDKISYVALTTDLWTSLNTKSFMTVCSIYN